MTRSSDLVMVEREVLERAHEALSRCYDVNDWPADGTTRQDAALRLLTSAIQSVEGGVQGSIATKQVTDETAASVLSRAAVFVAWAMREGPWEGGDLDGGALQDKAEELGLIIKTTYNPDIHGSCDYGSEPGDDWFVLHPDIEAAARLPAPPSPAKTGGDRG